MAKLKSDERNRLAEKIMEWGNLVFAGLVLAQIISNLSFNLWIAIVGVTGILTAYIVAILIMKGGGRK